MAATTRSRLGLAGLMVALFGSTVAARAADPIYGATNGGIVSEVRLGALAHDVAFAGGKEKGTDLNGEVIFVSPLPDSFGENWPLWLQWVAHPRPHIGGDYNLGGATSQLYTGLTWTATVARDIFRPGDALTLDYFFGPSINNGDRVSTDPTHKSLGSNVLFHLGGEIDYRINPMISIGLIYEHSSNAHLATKNQGLNNIGGRIGFHF